MTITSFVLWHDREGLRHVHLHIPRPYQLFYGHDMPKFVSGQAYLLEVGMMQILTDHETLSIISHVRIHVHFSSMTISLNVYLLLWSEHGRSQPFGPMRYLTIQWSRAVASLVCEVALILQGWPLNAIWKLFLPKAGNSKPITIRWPNAHSFTSAL